MKGYLAKGFTLLELMLVVGLGSMVALNEVDQERLKAEQLRTRAMAAEISQFQSALNSYISYHRGAVTSSSIPPELQGTKTGVNWMKRSSDCAVGTSSFPNEFLPCEYLSYNNSKLGFSDLEFVTFFDTTYDAESGIGKVVAKTVLSDTSSGAATPWVRDGEVAKGLSGLAAVIVNGDSVLAGSTTVVSRSTFCLGNTGVYCSDGSFPTADYAKDKIVLYNATAADNGIDLRVDGSNSMLGALTFHEDSSRNLREVRNVARLFGKSGEGVVIGDSGFYSGTLVPGDDLVVADADLEIYGSLVAKKNVVMEQALTVEGYARLNGGLGVDGDADITGNLTANGISANTVTSDSVSANSITATSGELTNLTVNDEGAFQNLRAFGQSILSRLSVNNESELNEVTVAGNVNLTSGSSQIQGIDTIVNDNDAVNKKYVDDRLPDLSGLQKQILDIVYPVGSYYINYKSNSHPGSTYGHGKWHELTSGRFIMAGAENSTVDYTRGNSVRYYNSSPGDFGGSRFTFLGTSQLPRHNHSILVKVGDMGDVTDGDNGRSVVAGDGHRGRMQDRTYTQPIRHTGGFTAFRHRPEFMAAHIFYRYE